MKIFAFFAAVVAVAVARPASTSWTVPMLDEALTNPNINPEIMPILEAALNEIMHSILTGAENQLTAEVALPAGVPIFLEPEHVDITPVFPTPVVPTPVVTPTIASPLVKIIINIDGKQQVADVADIERPVPEHVGAIERPTPVPVGEYNPVDIIAVNPIGVSPVDNN